MSLFGRELRSLQQTPLMIDLSQMRVNECKTARNHMCHESWVRCDYVKWTNLKRQPTVLTAHRRLKEIKFQPCNLVILTSRWGSSQYILRRNWRHRSDHAVVRSGSIAHKCANQQLASLSEASSREMCWSWLEHVDLNMVYTGLYNLTSQEWFGIVWFSPWVR